MDLHTFMMTFMVQRINVYMMHTHLPFLSLENSYYIYFYSSLVCQTLHNLFIFRHKIGSVTFYGIKKERVHLTFGNLRSNLNFYKDKLIHFDKLI